MLFWVKGEFRIFGVVYFKVGCSFNGIFICRGVSVGDGMYFYVCILRVEFKVDFIFIIRNVFIGVGVVLREFFIEGCKFVIRIVVVVVF